jgi:caffeoyl-CoA O-methyltransferase
MNTGYGQSDPKLATYVERVFQLADPMLESIQKRADAAGLPTIQVSAFDGRILELIARASNAKRAVEIGTLAGYSGTNILRGLGDGGFLYTFEFDPKHARVSEENLTRAGFEGRFKVMLGRAVERLPEIEKESPFDLVFIDANKEDYPKYLAWAEKHLRVGGVVLCDNAFAWGNVADPKAIDGSDGSATAIHQTNERLAQSGRFRAMMLPTDQGLAMGVKIR